MHQAAPPHTVLRRAAAALVLLCAAAALTTASAAALQPADVQITTDPSVTVKVTRNKTNTSRQISITLNPQDKLAIGKLAPPCPAQPAAETRPGVCPAGTTGSWSQTRSYTAAPSPTCWAAAAWSPAAAPDGACVAPPPPPVGGFDATGMPRVDMSKVPPVDPAQKYTTERVRPLPTNADGTIANPSVYQAYQNLGTIGAFREACGYAGMNRDDALVFPGQPGASHPHTYFGVIADAFTTTAGILNAPWSTCAGGLLNRTAYWMPSMIDTGDGAPLKPTSINVYYKGSYFFDAVADAPKIVPVPNGLHLIVGNATNTDPAKAAARFICMGPKGENPGWKNTIAQAFADGTCVPGGDFTMEIGFPICWDGVNLDSPDHKSHVVNPAQVQITLADGNLSFPWQCPSTHPVRLPTISYNVHYAIPDAQAVSRWYLSSDHSPAPAGTSAHADYFFGWDRKTVDLFTRKCINEQRDCHNYLLGDDLQMLY